MLNGVGVGCSLQSWIWELQYEQQNCSFFFKTSKPGLGVRLIIEIVLNARIYDRRV